MLSKTAKLGLILLLGIVTLHPRVATAQVCTSVQCSAMCSTPVQDMNAFKTVDKGFVKKLKSVSEDVMKSIDAMDAKVAEAIRNESAVWTLLWQDLTTNQIKDMEVIMKKRQEFAIEQRTLEATQIAMPSKNFTKETSLDLHWPSSEVMTRAMRQQLYADHTQRTELMSENYYSDKTNTRAGLSYDKGTVSGIAKLYQTHKDFFCNAAGAQKPSGCGDKAAAGVQMGDQMLEVYLGDGTWPEAQVQKSVELMQFYLGIKPPELPANANLELAEGQREYMDYQGNLARNNFLTYIMTYLVAKRAPTNEAQAALIDIRKKAAGCDQQNTPAGVATKLPALCAFLDGIVVKNKGQASRAELSKALQFDRFMNPAFITDSISGTMGIEKDLTQMMADRLQQDYEEYQMDKMITASMAGYYADLVNAKR